MPKSKNTVRVDIGRLDPTSMNHASPSIENLVLYTFLKNHEEKFISSNYYEVKISDKNTGINTIYRFDLDKSLLKRKRKNTNDDVYEILDEHKFIGSGDSGVIYLSTGSLSLNHLSNSMTYKIRNKAIKKTQKPVMEKERLLREYFLTNEARYLKTKKPVLIESNIINVWSRRDAYDMYMVMRYIDGVTLAEVFSAGMKSNKHDYISNKNRKKYFNADELIIISINLLNCMKIINELNISTIDLHSKNIMIEPETLDAFIIDFGSFQKIPADSGSQYKRGNTDHIINLIGNLWDINAYHKENRDTFKKHLTQLGLNDQQMEQLNYLYSYREIKSQENKKVDLIEELLILFQGIKDDRLLLSVPESIRDEVKYSLEASHTSKNALTNKTKPIAFIEQLNLISFYMNKISDKEPALEAFSNELGITYLKGSKSKDDLTTRLTELNECYNRINNKRTLLKNLNDILENLKKIQSKKSNDLFIIHGINSYIEYNDYLLNKKTVRMNIYQDIFKTESKIDHLILSISKDINENSAESHALHSGQVPESLINLELTLLKMKLNLVIKMYEAKNNTFINSWIQDRALSKRRQNDTKDLLQIIHEADSKDHLIEQIKSRCNLVERGALGRSELVDNIDKILTHETEKLISINKKNIALCLQKVIIQQLQSNWF